MSLNPTFDNVLALVFGTLDSVHQLHAPERPDDENDPGNCVHCEIAYPCETADLIFSGLAHISNTMQAAKEEEPANEETPAE